MEQVLKNIKKTRNIRGYSLENMATELNISDSTYRKIENNQTNLSLERFLQIAKILDVSINELIGEKSHRDYNQHHNEQGTFIGHQEFENYYQENKETTNKLLNSLESAINRQQEEILFLRAQLSNK
jgi:Predicted transcription factor, homolog of eukaryotic MBF1